jgi:hypothetical protein
VNNRRYELVEVSKYAFKPKNITVATAASRRKDDRISRKDNRIRISSCRPFLLVYILIGCNAIICIHVESFIYRTYKAVKLELCSDRQENHIFGSGPDSSYAASVTRIASQGFF